MSDPYSMVLINIVGSFLFVVTLLFYRFVYPKKKINLFVLLIFISCLPILSIFRQGSYESGDFNIHVRRAIDFYQSLSEGQILPSWAGSLNFSYGYPLYIFNYTFVYYFVAFFHFLGFSFIDSMKIFLGVNFLLSGIFMYFFTNKIFKNSRASFAAAIFYQFAPYHLIDLHFRATPGELMIFMILPLSFFLLHQFLEKQSAIRFILFVLSICLLILNHIVLAFFAIILILSYTLFSTYFSKNKKLFIFVFIGISISAICSSYTWLAPLLFSQYTIVTKMTFSIVFPHIWEFIFSPWKFGLLYQGHYGELSLLIGYFHLLIVGFILFKNNSTKHKKFVYFWLIAFCLFFFLMTSFSKYFWENLPFLKTVVGGSNRLLLFTSFITSILAGYFFLRLKKKSIFFFLIIVATILISILNWGHRRMSPEMTDKQLTESTWTEGDHFYANSKWINTTLLKNKPQNHIITSNKNTQIEEVQRNSTQHTYLIFTQQKTIFSESTMYFPGWQVFDNLEQIYTTHDKDGLITFTLPQGLHYIEIKYSDISLYKNIKVINISLFLMLLIFLSYKILKKS